MKREIPMRVVFGEMLCELASEYPELVVLDADCSSSTQTGLFGARYPERFYNFGIAEANMVSAAAGMAASGLLPVASTFAFLMALRAGDQVRSLVAYNNLNVKLAAGYAGLSDHADGASHQAIMDLAVARALPNMTVLVPSDIESTRGAVRAMLAHRGPVYLRLSRAPVPSLHGGDETFTIGRGHVLREGKDVTLVFCGSVIGAVLAAAERLEAEGVSTAVLELGSVKPLDGETLAGLARGTGAVVTVEEHSINGGLGGAVAECLAEACPVPVRRVGIRDTFGESGSYEQLLERYGLTSAAVVAAAHDVLGRKP
jgi:transketolase